MHTPVFEIQDMPIEELWGWVAIMNDEAEQRKQQQVESNAEASRNKLRRLK